MSRFFRPSGWLERAIPKLALLSAALLAMSGAQASVNTYTDQVSFLDGIQSFNAAKLIDFETPSSSLSAAAFTVSGTLAVGGVPQVIVDPSLWSTSGSAFLGANDPGNLGQFSSGDSITFTFGSVVHAFGLFAVAGSDVVAGDFTLSANGHVVSNADQGQALTDGAGSYGYFLGLVATTPDEGFSSITLSSTDHFYVYAADDVRYAYTPAVPEPATWTMVFLGLAMLSASRVLSRR